MRHVLVVDDDQSICKLLTEALEVEGGYRVTCVSTGKDGLAAVDRERPDVVVIDVVLPGLSGIEVAKHAIRRGIVVLLVTGHPERQDQLAAVDCPFLRKPFRLQQLLDGLIELAADAREHQHRMHAALALVPSKP